MATVAVDLMMKSYSGQSSYKFIDGLLRSEGKMLRIVSPFLDEHYARFLIGLAGRKQVRIITTGKGIAGSRAVALLSKGIRVGTLLKVFLYFAALFMIVAYLGIWYAAIGIAAAGALILFVEYERFKKGARNIEVRVSGGPFVHEKIYIGSDEAITGSANLTYSGTHRNVEHIEVTDDPSRIAELGRHFEELWKRE